MPTPPKTATIFDFRNNILTAASLPEGWATAIPPGVPMLPRNPHLPKFHGIRG